MAGTTGIVSAAVLLFLLAIPSLLAGERNSAADFDPPLLPSPPFLQHPFFPPDKGPEFQLQRPPPPPPPSPNEESIGPTLAPPPPPQQHEESGEDGESGEKKKAFNLGQLVGLAFLAIAFAMQIIFVGLIFYLRRRLLEIDFSEMDTETIDPQLPSSSSSSSTAA